MQKVILITLIVMIGFISYLYYDMKKIPKVGVVDNAVLLSQFSEAIVARQKLESEKKKWENNVKSLEDSVKAAFENLKGNYDKSSDGKRVEMQKSLQRWNEELQRYTGAVEAMSRQKEAELLKPILERLNSFVKVWAKGHGYPIIIGTGNGGVILSAADQVNVTDQILEALNKYYGTTAVTEHSEPEKVSLAKKDTISAR